MSTEIEIELLQERIDSMNVVNEELRERSAQATKELALIHQQYQELEQRNKDLTAQMDRLRLHIQQGVEL
jgi:chromosome segregation ATPase